MSDVVKKSAYNKVKEDDFESLTIDDIKILLLTSDGIGKEKKNIAFEILLNKFQ